MLKRLRIRTKILAAFFIVAVVAIAVIAFFAFLVGSSTLREEYFSELTAVREMKASQIEDYFRLIEDQVVIFSEDRMIIEAMRAFDDGLHTLEEDLRFTGSDFETIDADLEAYYREEFLPRLAQNLEHDPSLQDFWLEDESAKILQYLYLADNPFEVGAKHLLDEAGDGSSYSQSHEEFHPLFRNFQEKFGYYDIFLVDVDTGGHIAYSVFKEVDFGTSLLDGPYADSNIGQVYQAALNTNNKDAVFLVDYDFYAPSYNAPAAFVASPIFDGEEKIGVLIFQLPIDRIDAIMTSNRDWKNVGLGESGETYLVGDDFTLRNQSRFLIEDSESYFKLIEAIGIPAATIERIRNLGSTIGLQEVRTEGTQAALAGETGAAIFPDYRGVPVLSAYKPLEITDLKWVIMSEVDEAEAFAPIRSLGLSLALGSLGLIAFIIIAATAFARVITRPIEALQSQARQISAGNLDTRIRVDTEDEISDLADTLETMRLSNKALIDDLADINQNLENLVAERTAELEASERQSKSIIELSGDAIIVADELGKVLVWNARAEQIFGYSREEMIGTRVDQIVPASYKAGHTKAFAQARDTQGLKQPGINREVSGQRKDGTEFPVELSLAHWQLGDKNFFSASIRDITERKQAEQAIRDREERIRSIVEIAPDAIISIDGKQNIVMFNSQAEEIFGYSADEVLGQPVTMLMPEGARGIHPHEVRKFLNEPINARSMDQRREIAGRRKDGTIFPGEAGISKLELDGTVLFTAFFRDITERKRLEREIADQLSFVRTLVDTIPNPIFALDPGLRYVLLNQAYEKAYGIDREKAIGKTILELDHLTPEDKELYYAQDKAVLEKGSMSHDEFEVRYSDGQLHTILEWVTPFKRSDGSTGGLVGITADITEQKEMERLLAIANERMSTELNFARDIQLDMLPLIFPAFPNRTEVIVYAALESAREVGGDFYDFYFLDDDHLCFVIGDVAGKGAPGALMMAVSKTLIKSRAADDDEPASILTHVNDELSRDNKSSMFVTVFLGLINVKTGELVYTNAGHNPPYIRRRDGSLQKVDAFHGPVIGAMPGMPYQQDSEILHPGEVILLYTDGVTEAFNEEEQLFSEDRLETVLSSKPLDSAERIVTGTVEAVHHFAGEAEQSDDITLLAVQYVGLPESMETKELNITIKNLIEEMEIVDEQFSNFAQENALPEVIRQSISIVLDEMLNNIISYAYQGEKEKEIEVGFELSGKRLVLTIKDSGVPFNPFGRETPDISTPIEERAIGGLGIHMVRNLMDEYSYQRQINKNVVTLVKLIGE